MIDFHRTRKPVSWRKRNWIVTLLSITTLTILILDLTMEIVYRRRLMKSEDTAIITHPVYTMELFWTDHINRRGKKVGEHFWTKIVETDIAGKKQSFQGNEEENFVQCDVDGKYEVKNLKGTGNGTGTALLLSALFAFDGQWTWTADVFDDDGIQTWPATFYAHLFPNAKWECEYEVDKAKRALVEEQIQAGKRTRVNAIKGRTYFTSGALEGSEAPSVYFTLRPNDSKYFERREVGGSDGRLFQIWRNDRHPKYPNTLVAEARWSDAAWPKARARIE